MYVPSHVLSGLYYNKHRSIATGIATAGSGLGATIFPVVIYNLIEHYGWRGSLFILAGLNLHNFIFCALLFPVPDKSTEENIQETEKLTNYIDRRKNSIGESVYMLRAHSISLSEIKEEHAHIDTQVTFKKDSYKSTTVDRDQTISLNGSVPNSRLQRRQSVSQRLERHFCSIFSFAFIVYFLSNIFWNAGGAIILIFLPEYMTSIGFSKEEASSIFTLVGAGTCVGCILGGLLGNIKNINRELIYILGNLAAGLLALLYPWQLLHTKLGQILLSASFGLAFGIILGLLVVVTADLLGTESLGDGFGYLMLANGIGIFSGPPVAGQYQYLN